MRLILVALLFTACFLGLGQACSVACPESVPSFVVPKVKSVYVYSLEAKTLLTPRDTQKVTIKADAEVSFVDRCQSVLHLKNVVIEGVPNGAELATELSSKPLAFGYFNGRLLGVCTSKDDEDWSTNIKKAVVSALQVQLDEERKSIDEIDFSGRCPTEYHQVKNTDGVMVIEKKKDLNLCDDRRIDLRQTPDQALGQLKEFIRHYTHPMESDLSCRITIKEKMVNDVDCEERHVLVHRSQKPLHISNVKLNLKETKDGVAETLNQDSESKQAYLSFAHKHKNPTETDVVEVLKKLCSEISENSASIETSFTFQKLVDKLRYLSNDETASVDEAVKSSICPSAQKRIRELFLDASAFAASDSSIKTLVKAHENEELSLIRSTALFSVVALKAAPNKDTVQSLLPLISSDKTSRPLLLGFSVLVRRYCEKTADCAINTGVKNAREAYLTRLASAKEVDERLAIVRALENLNANTDGTEHLINSLDEIIKSSNDEPVVRAAAVNAFPNDPSHNDRFKSLVMDESNPNEVRVAAFQKMVKNNGLNHVKEMFGVQNPCIKNYVLSYVNNLKKSNNELRKKLLTEDIELPEQPDTNLGITRNIAREYGPYTFEYDIIYPEHENTTRSVNARVTRASKGKLKEIVEIQLYQKGFDKEINNILNLLKKKSLPHVIQFIRDFIRLLLQLRKSTKNQLMITVKVNGKNIMSGNMFEDIHIMGTLLKKRIQNVLKDKNVDRTIGGVLIDSKVVIPTITGLPLIYKLNDNFVLQYNGVVNTEKNNANVKLIWSYIAGLHGSMKLKVKDQKMGYEYDAKLAYTPHLDFDVEKKPHALLLRWNVKDIDQRTVMKFKQSLREKRATGEEKDYENELVPDARSDNCFSLFLLNYCRKASQIKGLILPNVEYYIVKPEKEVTAFELEFKGETEDNEGSSKKTRRYIVSLTAVGSPTNRQAKAQIEIKQGEEYKITFKSPEHEFNFDFTVAVDKNNLKMKVDLPNVIKADVNGVFELDKNNVRKNKLNIEYQFPGEDKKHTIDYENEFLFNLKRSSKEKNSTLDYKSKLVFSRRPCLNHKSVIQFKYRPFKVNELNLEFAFGEEFKHHYQLMRKTMMEVEEMNPFKINGKSEIKLIASTFDVDYDLKSDFKYESRKDTPVDLQYKIKGKDRSKRAAELKQEDIEGMIDYKNQGSPINSKMNANLKIHGNQYAYESELKQVEPQQYEGKITLTKNDKKIFINHKDVITKPTDTFHVKAEAEITYSDSPDKKNAFVEFKREKDTYSLKTDIKRNGETYYENDINLQKNGKLKWRHRRNDRSFDLDVDNMINPKIGKMMLKIKDRVYDIDLNRAPFSQTDLTVKGNDQAYIKKGNFHMSLVDPSTFNIVTKNDGKIDLLIDVITPITKSASLKIDSKKYNLFHEGDITISILNPRLSWNHYTKREDREYKINADMAPKGTLITFKRITPEKTSNIKYSRQGDEIDIDIDTSLIEGHVDGTIKSGKIHMKGRQSNFEIESTWKYEDGKIIIEPVKSDNGKLEGVLSRKAPSKLVLETPRVKFHMDYDRFSPVKIFKVDFDSPQFEHQIDAEYEPLKRYKYHIHGKSKEKNREYTFSLNGIPNKALNLNVDAFDFKFNVNKPEDSNKAQFSYTFNEYTETEEYEFDPHKAYLLNWLRAIRQYIQSFIVE